MYVVLYSRKERLCNSCVNERQQETTSECEDTESDNELGSSSQRDSSPPTVDNTPRDVAVDNDHDSSTVCADDSILSSCDSLLDSAAGENEAMSRSDAAASWSMRGTAFSALSWVSGVMSRSFVRSHVTDGGQPEVGDDDDAANVQADTVQSEETIGVNGEWAASVVDDTETEALSSSLTDNISADSPADIDVRPTSIQRLTPGSHTAIGMLSCHDSSVCDSSHGLTTSDISESLPTDDSVHRYLCIYFSFMWCRKYSC